jgi:hypothetical protein
MAGNEGRTALTAARSGRGPSEWGRARRLAATLLVAFSMVGAMSVVLAGTTSAQTASDAVLQWLPEIQSASAQTGVPAEYIAAVIRVESGGDPNAVSSAGAIGLMQVMSYEFESQGISSDLWYDPGTNILAGSTEIGKFMASTGSIEQALASYFGSGCDSTGTCTDGYISTVLGYAAAYATAIANGTAVDISGVTTTTGTGTTTDTGTGTVDPGLTGGGSWQGEVPANESGSWQGGPPADGGSGGAHQGGGDWSGGATPDAGATPDDGTATNGGEVIDDTGANG